MNKVDAQRVFSSILKFFESEDPENFERDYVEDVSCHINSQVLNLEQFRLRLIFFMNHYHVEKVEVTDFIYEDQKACMRFFMEIKRKEDDYTLKDEVFCLYHFEDQKVKESWMITQLPFDEEKPAE